MTTPARPRVYVPAPTVEPRPYGLWSVVQTPDGPDPHWRQGVVYQPDVPDRAGLTLGDCPPIDDTERDDFAKPPTSDGLPARGADPFSVYARVLCGPVGGMWDEAIARASAALNGGEARAVERAFWTGQADQPAGATIFPHLAANAAVNDDGASGSTVIQPAAVVPQAGPMDIVEALGVLEGYMGSCYPGVPVIHMPLGVVAEASSYNLIHRQGPQLRTLAGSLVAAGAGYPGTGPDGTTPPYPQTWIYATGAVFGRRGPVQVSNREQALDRAVNDLVLIPERTYVIGWDHCLAAALVHVGGRASGGGGEAGHIGS